jgi:hypothetical protein
MTPTFKIPYARGELRIGWASWDDGSMQKRSIKYAYADSAGKISRGCPEVPIEILADMFVLALDQNEIAPEEIDTPRRQKPTAKMSKNELTSENIALAQASARLLILIQNYPWLDCQAVYEQLATRRNSVQAELAARKTP